MTQTRQFRLFAYLSFFSIAALLAGCAATEVALSKKDLDVQTKMSDTVFLDPVSPEKKVIYIDVRNTSDKANFDIKTPIITAIQSRGFRVTLDPEEAHYHLQANVLRVEKASPSAAQLALSNGYGGEVLAGAVAGAVVSDNYYQGAAVGGLLAGGASVIANSLVHDVTFMAITDIQISERAKEGVIVRSDSQQDLKQGIGGSQRQSSSGVGDMKKYRSRVVSTANKVNLAYEEASPKLTEGLTRSISGLF